MPAWRIGSKVFAAAAVLLAGCGGSSSSMAPQPAPDAGLPPQGAQQASQDIRGISACKVYPPRQLLAGAVGSYPTFSPSSAKADSYFLWHYLFPIKLGSRLFTGRLPCAVRTFLPPAITRRTIARVCSKYKNTLLVPHREHGLTQMKSIQSTH